MKTEKIYSQVELKGKDVITQPFWDKCFHEEDVTPEMRESSGKQWYCYHVKFDGLTPIQITKKKKV